MSTSIIGMLNKCKKCVKTETHIIYPSVISKSEVREELRGAGSFLS